MRVRERKLYHICNKESLSSILSQGLITGLTNPTKAKGHLSAIYLTNDWVKLREVDKDFDGEKALLSVDCTGLDLVRDDNYKQSEGNEFAYYHKGSIAPSKIKFIKYLR